MGILETVGVTVISSKPCMFTETYPSSLAVSRTSTAPEPISLGELEDSAGETKVELLRLPDDGSGAKLQLVEYSWGSGLGWYARKRLTLDAEQGAGLASLLTAALAPVPTVSQPLTRAFRPAVEREGNVIRLFPSAD